MRDDNRPAQAEQVSAAVDLRVESPLDPPSSRPDHRPPSFPTQVDAISSRSTSWVVRMVPSSSLRAMLPNKAIGHDDIGGSLEQQPTLDVSDEGNPVVGGKKRMGLLRQTVALLRLFADRQEADVGVSYPDDLFSEKGAHVSELGEMLRSSVGIRAGIEQDEWPLSAWDRDGDGRAHDSGEPANLEQRSSQHRARVASRDRNISVALGNGPAGREQRAVALLARRICRLLVHLDHPRGVHEREVAGTVGEQIAASVQGRNDSDERTRRAPSIIASGA